MTDKQYKAKTRLISRLLNQWIKRLGLIEWDVKVQFLRELHENDQEIRAECDCAWEYRQIGITFYVPSMEGYDEETITDVVVHELVHGIVNEMRPALPNEAVMKHEERVVTHVAKAIQDAYIFGYNDGLKEKG